MGSHVLLLGSSTDCQRVMNPLPCGDFSGRGSEACGPRGGSAALPHGRLWGTGQAARLSCPRPPVGAGGSRGQSPVPRSGVGAGKGLKAEPAAALPGAAGDVLDPGPQLSAAAASPARCSALRREAPINNKARKK